MTTQMVDSLDLARRCLILDKEKAEAKLKKAEQTIKEISGKDRGLMVSVTKQAARAEKAEAEVKKLRASNEQFETDLITGDNLLREAEAKLKKAEQTIKEYGGLLDRTLEAEAKLEAVKKMPMTKHQRRLFNKILKQGPPA